MWYIEYLDEGTYMISAIQNADLHITSLGDSDIYLHTEADTSTHQWLIYHDAGGYRIVSYDMGPGMMTYTAPSTYVPNGRVEISYANTYQPKHYWQFTAETATGLMLLDSTTGERRDSAASNTAVSITTAQSKTLNELGIDLHIFDNENTSQAFLLYTNPSNMVSFNMGNNTLSGTSQGTATATISRPINNVLYTITFPLISYREIYIVNYYDTTISNNSTVIGYMDDAVNFLNHVYKDSFYLTFVMDGAPQLYTNSPIAQCSNGANGPCGSNCYPSNTPRCYYHHKNVYRISDELRANGEDSHVYVLWSNSASANYCYEDSRFNLHTSVGDGKFAVVVGFTDAITFYQIDLIDSDACLASMSITLAHEIVHTLGMVDVYSTLHDGAYGYQCIMEFHQSGLLGDYYDNIMRNTTNPATTAFCSSCISTLNTTIASHDFSIRTESLVLSDDE